jgi:hypothetical protein
VIFHAYVNVYQRGTISKNWMVYSYWKNGNVNGLIENHIITCQCPWFINQGLLNLRSCSGWINHWLRVLAF